MKKNIKRLCAAALTAAVLSTQMITGGFSAMATENGTGAQLTANGLSETVEGGAILHCWCWNFNTIRENIPEIAAAGFSAIQTSPVCEVNNGGDGSLSISRSAITSSAQKRSSRRCATRRTLTVSK